MATSLLPCFTHPSTLQLHRDSWHPSSPVSLFLPSSAWDRKHLKFKSAGPYWTDVGYTGLSSILLPWNLSYINQPTCQVLGRMFCSSNTKTSQSSSYPTLPQQTAALLSLSLVNIFLSITTSDVPALQLASMGPWYPQFSWVPGMLVTSHIPAIARHPRHMMNWTLFYVHQNPLHGIRAWYAGDSKCWASPCLTTFHPWLWDQQPAKSLHSSWRSTSCPTWMSSFCTFLLGLKVLLPCGFQQHPHTDAGEIINIHSLAT